MDVDDFRVVLESCGVDVWTFIETAIAVAAADYGAELKRRRDGIVERLYAGTSSSSSAAAEQPRCRNCDDVDDLRPDNCLDDVKAAAEKGGSPGTPQSVEREDGEELDPYAGLFDDEQKKILDIKEHLEDPHQVFFFFFLDFNLVILVFLGLIFLVGLVCFFCVSLRILWLICFKL
jgi:hypothetical protein